MQVAVFVVVLGVSGYRLRSLPQLQTWEVAEPIFRLASQCIFLKSFTWRVRPNRNKYCKNAVAGQHRNLSGHLSSCLGGYTYGVRTIQGAFELRNKLNL